MHTVIIGDGVTAASFAAAIDPQTSGELTIIGKQVGQFGRGLAYQEYPAEAPWRYAYLLNSPTDFVDSEFAGWLRTNWAEVHGLMCSQKPDWNRAGQHYIDRDDIEGLFAPRALYGEFLERKARVVLDEKRSLGVAVRMLCDVVVEITSEARRFKVLTELGEVVTADQVLVGIGGPANRPLPLGNADITGYFASLYGSESEIVRAVTNVRSQLNRMGERVKVACIGANASMLDVLRLLQSCFEEDWFEFIAIAPAGLLPEPVLPRKPRELYQPRQAKLSGPFARAADFLAAVDAEIAYARKRGYMVAELRSGFIEFFKINPLSELLWSSEEARVAASQLESRFRRGTRDSIEDFQRLSVLGTARLIKGKVTELRMGVEDSSGKAQVQVQYHDMHDEIGQQNFDLVVNCTGPLPTAIDNNSLDPLTRKLISNGWLAVCPITRGIQVSEQLESQKPGLFYLSPGTTVVGEEPLPFPLYDVQKLPQLVLTKFTQAARCQRQSTVG